jgi:hypothetical protein
MEKSTYYGLHTILDTIRPYKQSRCNVIWLPEKTNQTAFLFTTTSGHEIDWFKSGVKYMIEGCTTRPWKIALEVVSSACSC